MKFEFSFVLWPSFERNANVEVRRNLKFKNLSSFGRNSIVEVERNLKFKNLSSFVRTLNASKDCLKLFEATKLQVKKKIELIFKVFERAITNFQSQYLF